MDRRASPNTIWRKSQVRPFQPDSSPDGPAFTLSYRWRCQLERISRAYKREACDLGEYFLNK